MTTGKIPLVFGEVVHSMSNIALFVAQGVQDEEYLYPYYRFQEEEFQLDVILSYNSRYPNPTGKYGIPIKWNMTTKELTFPCKHDILVIAGGWQAPEIMRQDLNLLKYLDSANDQNKVIGAICHGPQVLISANIVKNRKMTSFAGIKDDIVNAGAYYIDRGVVVDDNLITAQHYKDNPLFLRSILEAYKYHWTLTHIDKNNDKYQYPM